MHAFLYNRAGYVRWLVSGLVWAGWYWFIVKEKYYWLTSLGWLKPTSEQKEEDHVGGGGLI